MTAVIEHANFTVSDPGKTANYLANIFDWKIRWSGESIYGGHTIHIGGPDSYVALYSGPSSPKTGPSTYQTVGGFNHLGVVVSDLDSVEERVKSAGFTPENHGDYEPGRRFYFHDHDGIEIKVVSYQ